MDGAGTAPPEGLAAYVTDHTELAVLFYSLSLFDSRFGSKPELCTFTQDSGSGTHIESQYCCDLITCFIPSSARS